MNRKELNNILKNHKKWLEGEEGGAFATWPTGSAWCLWGGLY